MSDHSLAQNPYAPPAVADAESLDAAPDGGKRNRRWALLHLLVSIALAGGTLLVAMSLEEVRPAAAGFAAAALVALVGLARGIASLVQAFRAPGRAVPGRTWAVVFALLANGVMAFLGAAWAMLATVQFSRGRQLRRFGRVLLPRVAPGGAWTEVPLTAQVDEPARRALAAQWRENGRTEHASVAAFARLTLDLMALGAPPALVAAANRDALDEIRHTELCFSLARALDGEREGPAPFPEAQRARTLPPSRTLALAALAVDSLVDGALHEGVSARVIARLVKRCEEPQIRAVLKEIAADEGRHAAHGWDVVAWCLAEGGGAVADALRGALQTLPREMRTPLPDAAAGGGWERFGIHGRALEAAELADTRSDLVRRVERMIGEGVAAAA
jgi:hypothetical protein